MKRAWILGLVLSSVTLLGLAPTQDAEAGVIRSWNAANQRFGDLFGGGSYTSFNTRATGNGHTILQGIGTLSAANLAGVDVFFWGTSSHVLNAGEQAALNSFITGGGWLIIETNSITSEQVAANSAYSALGLGNPVGAPGGGNVGGTFNNVLSSALVGPNGDLRGQTWAGSITVDLNPAGGLLLGTNNNGQRSWVEWTGIGAGGVLGVGDPFGIDLFQGNPNNISAYLNFIDNNHPVRMPEPGTIGLLAAGGLLLVARARRQH